MKNLFIIPTDKPSRLYTNMQGVLSKDELKMRLKNYNIYITNDEEIKEGNWCFEVHNGDSKANSPKFIDEQGNTWWLRKANANDIAGCPTTKKIILTTDQDLIADGVQLINDEFLEWFVKNPSCEKVEVKKGLMKLNDDGEEYGFPDMSLYKIIIPKEEFNYNMKQKTLEEAAERAIKSGLFKDETLFIAGAKWQQEKIYNEIKELYDNENITGFSKLAYAKCLDIIKKK